MTYYTTYDVLRLRLPVASTKLTKSRSQNATRTLRAIYDNVSR